MGGVVLLDSGNGRVVTLDANGRLVGETPFPMGATGVVHSIATLAGGRIALHGSRRLWGLWDGGDVVEAASPENLGDPQMLHHWGHAARWQDSSWVFGFGFGNGWMVFDGANLSKVRPYALHTDFPEVLYMRQGFSRSWRHVTRPVSSGLSMSVRGDTLFVLFGGPTRSQYGRLLDRFDLRTGSYIGSEALPHSTNRGVVGESGRMFTVNNSSLFPSIVALGRRQPSEVIVESSSSTTPQGVPQ